MQDAHDAPEQVPAATFIAGAEHPATRSYMHLPAVFTGADGVPVSAYGRIFVYGVSPDFETNVVIQGGNQSTPTKIRPKKSWEIGENGIGSMVSWAPRVPQNDLQPFLSINLIDGDPATCWCSHGQGQPTVEPVWIRVDLARETRLREVVLVPRADGHGLPAQLTIKLSCDGWHWDTLYEGRTDDATRDGARLVFPLAPPAPVKQIWVTGYDLPRFAVADWTFINDGTQGNMEHNFVLAGVEARDERGDNVALASRGAGVTVSSTNYGWG
jgi:hypothetical protein